MVRSVSDLPPRVRAWLRVALIHYITSGLVAALGLLLISSGVNFFAGALAASVASVGVVVCIPPDQAAPRRGKLWRWSACWRTATSCWPS